MTSRSDLIPTSVVDKNGKQTTVYRRRERSGGVTVTFPTPTVVESRAAREALVRETAMVLVSAADAPEYSLITVTRDLDRCSDELIDHIAEVLNAVHDAEVEKKVARKIGLQIMRKPKDGDAGAAHEEELHEELYLYPFVPEAGPTMLRRIIESVRRLPQFSGMTSLRDASGDELKNCRALARVMSAALEERLLDPYSDYYVFEDERVTSLVLEYPEHARLIADVIHDRYTLDPVLLREMVESEASALGSGIL
jgi:hypothetical protein